MRWKSQDKEITLKTKKATHHTKWTKKKKKKNREKNRSEGDRDGERVCKQEKFSANEEKT